MPEPNLTTLSSVLSCLGDLNRLRIVTMICHEGPVYPTQIMDRLGLVESTLHHHLGTLVGSNVLFRLKRGKFTLYELNHALIHQTLSQLSELLEPERISNADTNPNDA